MTLGIASCQEGVHGLKTAQGHFSLQNSVASCLVFMLYVGLSQVFAFPILVCLTQGDIHSLLMNSGTNTYTTSWSTQLLIAKTKATLYVEIKVSFFATVVVSLTLHYTLSELHGYIALAIALWVFFHFRGLFVSHIEAFWAFTWLTWGSPLCRWTAFEKLLRHQLRAVVCGCILTTSLDHEMEQQLSMTYKGIGTSEV